MKETLDEVIFGLTDEEYINRATDIFEHTLNGLGRADQYRININRAISFMPDASYFGESQYKVSIDLLILPEEIASILDKQFETLKDAIKSLALCACQFALHHAENKLATRPDEQGWMPETMSYWHKLKEEVIEFREQHLK
jgi:hypothetical protein